MRDFLDGILTFIGAESLTDLEFESLTVTDEVYDSTTYDALAGILLARESVSSMQDRLTAFFTAKGVEVTPVETASSNVFLGGALCD